MPELVRMTWRGKQSQVMRETAREVDVEGAIRSGKTTVCMWKEHSMARQYPGIGIILARWSEGNADGLLKPLWNAICTKAGDTQTWLADERCYLWPNGSRIYIIGLKAQEASQRYSKFRGKTVSRVYVDQAEEVPYDVYLELAGRLSQPGYDHQITISPQSVPEDHWIAQHFPDDPGKQTEHKRYYSLSIYDNQHNLHPDVIPSNERLYPPGHPKHRTLILGLRGLDVRGEPVYKGAFVRAIHEREIGYDRSLPLEMALDFGKHHPCVVFAQRSSVGQVRYLGGILGQQLYLDEFIDAVVRYRNLWFPGVTEILECCDPAGASDTSHGTAGAVKLLRARGINPRWQPDANNPAVRLACIERIASQMRQRASDRSEAFVVSADPERWLRISETGATQDKFFVDGLEAGYVWDEHMVSVGSKQIRKPKKDGWYEHGMNCLEYLECNFGGAPKVKRDRPIPQVPVLTGSMGWAG